MAPKDAARATPRARAAGRFRTSHQGARLDRSACLLDLCWQRVGAMAGSKVVNAYLAAYNLTQTCGWAYALYQCVVGFKAGGVPGVYPAAVWAVGTFQLLAFMEVVHAALRIVRSSPVQALMQWGGRSHVLFALLKPVAAVHPTPFAAALFAAWAISEVCRYPLYLLGALGLGGSSLGKVVEAVRYNAFVPLYPVGVASELAIMYLALPVAEAAGWYCIRLPNAVNFAFYYPWFLRGLMGVYPILWLQLYTYMFRQRAKWARGGSKGKKD
ncbi:unnamed protein product [Pedinophyceae sp. YPF-701]|nr:unnamed protein product [Pedinophyceae sp. YPF-701]